MNNEQQSILKMIESEKKKKHPDKGLLRKWVKDLTAFDVRNAKVNDAPGGGSRSPSFGKYDYDSSPW